MIKPLLSLGGTDKTNKIKVPHAVGYTCLRHKRQSSIRFRLCEWPGVQDKSNLDDKQCSYSTLDITSNHFKNHSASLHSFPSSSICFFP